MANVNDININPKLVKIPTGFSSRPQVGKIQQLYDLNNNDLYKRLSPYTPNSGLFSFGPRQPFLYVNPNQGRKGINGLKRFQSRSFPFASSLLDTARIAKFLVSGNGILFIAKQFYLQKSQPFNETRLYNPLSPLLAVSTRINPFSDKHPSRFIDTSGGLLGSLASLVGISIKSKPSAPKGTVGLGALPPNVTAANSKGLLRAHTAISGYNRLKNLSPDKKGGLKGALLSMAKSLFGGFGGQKQPVNASFRSDEGGYGIQLASNSKFDYCDKNGTPVKWGTDYYMRFEAGSSDGNAKVNIRKEGETSKSDGVRSLKVFGQKIPHSSQYFGLELGNDGDEDSTKYGEQVGRDAKFAPTGYGATTKFSDILSVYNVYTGVKGTVEDMTPVITDSKFTDKTKQSFKDVEDGLKRVITKLKESGYEYKPIDDHDLLNKQFSNKSFAGMDNITYKTRDPNKPLDPRNYNDSYEADFRTNKTLLDRKKGFAGAGRQDSVNSLSILSKTPADASVFENKHQKQTYDPYKDDQIAFYFRDLVNDKYIPFRATVTGINERSAATWNPISYIGRSDKLYNYGGFSRAIDFKFKVVAMSVKELLPMWKRINYLFGLTKPSNYTAKNFAIPPLTTFTIGDLYKDQPLILENLSLSIPEDALWETLSEKNFYDQNNDWKYSDGRISWKDSSGKYAQFPMECEISVAGQLLEKQRPQTGQNNWASDVGAFDSEGDKNRQTFSDKLSSVNPEISVPAYNKAVILMKVL